MSGESFFNNWRQELQDSMDSTIQRENSDLVKKFLKGLADGIGFTATTARCGTEA